MLLAVHWSRIDDVLNRTGDLSGKVIITCSLPMNDDNTELFVAHTSSGAEELAKVIPKARVVSAFNTVPSEVLFSFFEARRKTTRPSLVYGSLDIPSRSHYSSPNWRTREKGPRTGVSVRAVPEEEDILKMRELALGADTFYYCDTY